MTLELPNELILICGPAASGKTTLAQRIFSECPRKNKTLVTFPVEIIMGDESERRNHLVTRLQQRQHGMEDLTHAYGKRAFTICDGCYTDADSLHSFLYWLRMMNVYFDVTLIKMAPPLDLLEQRVTERLEAMTVAGETDGQKTLRMKSAMNALCRQNRDFDKLVQRQFAQEISWVKHEYLVTNSDDVELRFL